MFLLNVDGYNSPLCVEYNGESLSEDINHKPRDEVLGFIASNFWKISEQLITLHNNNTSKLSYRHTRDNMLSPI